MSSKGSLATGGYTRQTVDMARRHPDFVFGFIAQSRVHEVEGDAADNGADYLILSPGVNLETKGDGLGQQYRTPKQVVGDAGCDVCIVGRGVCVRSRSRAALCRKDYTAHRYGNGNDRSDEEIRAAAERYRAACWQAYVDRLAR
jgi:orotidine-5'-phosphate decarboxylase